MLKKNNWKLIIIFILILLFFLLGIVFVFVSKGNVKKTKKESQLETIIIPPQKSHSATVIFLHGLGNDAKNSEELFEPISKKFPNFKFIFPQAPIIPVSMNWGLEMPAWYNIKGSSRDILKLKEDKDGLINSVAKIKNIIQQEINSGIPAQKIIIIGHSQGASVAITLGLTSDHLLAGVVGLSSFLPCRNEIFNLAKEKNKQIPFFLYHNYYDNVISAEIGEQSAQLLKEKGYKVEFEDGYNGSHFFRPEEFQEIITENLNKLIS